MNTLHRSIFFCQLLLHLGTVCKGLMQRLSGRPGESVTLPCYYDIKYQGPTEMCWGRAKVPTSKCSKTIVTADGKNLTWRQSERYQLQSGVTNGNVSLTIINVTEHDSGIYGCRVEIPGWFNDQKYHFDLIVVKDNGETQKSTTAQNTPDKPTAGRTAATANATEWSPLSSALTTEAQPSSGYSSQTDLQSSEEDSWLRLQAGIIIPLIIVLFLAATLLVTVWQKKKNKTQFVGNAQMNQPSSSSFTASVPTLETTDRETVENIYQ